MGVEDGSSHMVGVGQGAAQAVVLLPLFLYLPPLHPYFKTGKDWERVCWDTFLLSAEASQMGDTWAE